MGNLEVSLRRIIVGYRVIAAVWLAVLGLITVRGDAPPDRPGIVLAVIALVFVWTAITVALSFREAPQLGKAWFLAADVGVAVVTLVAPDWAGSANFYGGYPISSVLVAAYGAGLTGGVLLSLGLLALFKRENILKTREKITKEWRSWEP